MLGKEIQEFIGQMKALNQVGCLLVPRSSLERLLTALNQADRIVGKDIVPGRVTYCLVTKETHLNSFINPAILVVTEEDYASDNDWAEKIREKAAYFMNVV